MSEVSRILIVDDNANNRIVVRKVLKGVAAELHEASNGFDALSMSLQNEYALILLDVQMPDMDGFEVCELLRADPRTADIPVILLTAASKNLMDKVRGYVAGATDYLTKPINDHILNAKVQVFLKMHEQQRMLRNYIQHLRVAATVFESQQGMTITNARCEILRVNKAFTEITGYSPDEVLGKNPKMLHSGRHDAGFYRAMWESIARTGSWQGEIWDQRKEGQIYPEWLCITAVKGDDGVATNYVGTFTDITLRKEAESKIEHLAFHDHLTGLPNRKLMIDRLEQALLSALRRGRPGAVMMIDLDNFKIVNDTLGHAVGDKLLIQTAKRLQSCMREGDTVARLGGDEFVVILADFQPGEKTAVHTRRIAEKIQTILAVPYELEASVEEPPRKISHVCTSSLGITLFVDQSVSAEDLIRRADTAMYRAKMEGRNTFRFFDAEMQRAVTERATREAELRTAIIERQFVLHYQAQMGQSGFPMGAEALVRWQHPGLGLISPAEFIPVAEETGLILPLGHWVLETACKQLAAWSKNPEAAQLKLAVNISARQISLPNFVEEVRELLSYTKAPIENLKLELTESLLLENTEDTIKKMLELKSMGVGFSLDDFGTGYSSLSYLKRLPIDQLKIDRSFVRDLLADTNDAVITRTIVALGNSLGLDVIAEGVETEAQKEFLASVGCHSFQGYLIGRPLPLQEFEEYLSRVAVGESGLRRKSA